jgi:5-methylcytosine-specific restriction endonuclease McrA
MTKQISDSELIEELHRLSKEFCDSESPKIKKLESYGKYSRWTYENRFGSWNDALKKAGYEINVKDKVEKEDLTDDFQRVSENKSDREIATVSEIEEYSEYCKSTYFNHFEDWRELIRQSGFGDVDGNFQDSGSEHYRWKGGVSFDSYGKSWETQRKECLKRDGFSCCVCKGENAPEYFENPDVHHISPKKNFNVDKEHKEMNDLSNLICLCRSCHREFEGKWQDSTPEEFVKKAKKEIDY